MFDSAFTVDDIAEFVPSEAQGDDLALSAFTEVDCFTDADTQRGGHEHGELLCDLPAIPKV